MTGEMSVEQQAFTLSILEAREKAGKLTDVQSEQLKKLRELEKQRRGGQGTAAGISIESQLYHGGIAETPASDNPLKKVQEKRADKQAKLGGTGGSHN